jgi:hypothetical protein
MKALSNLPDDDHVMRYVPWGRLRRDGDDNVLGFLPQGFQRRETEESLSVNWIEYFSGDRHSQITASVRMFRQTITVGSKSAFGIGNVGKTKDVCRAHGAVVRIVLGARVLTLTAEVRDHLCGARNTQPARDMFAREGRAGKRLVVGAVADGDRVGIDLRLKADSAAMQCPSIFMRPVLVLAPKLVATIAQSGNSRVCEARVR